MGDKFAEMSTCPKYLKCSASICPLDQAWREAKHHKGERVCFYLCETQKSGSEALFRGRGLSELYKLMIIATQEISARWGAIRNALRKSAMKGSRMDIDSIQKKPRNEKAI